MSEKILSSFYGVKWRDFSSYRLSSQMDFFKRQVFVDVTLVCDDHKFEAHQIVISSASPIFQNILEQDNHPHPIIYLKGIQRHIFGLLLDFIYAGEVSIPENEFETFMKLAKEFKIKGLTDEGLTISGDKNIELESDSTDENKQVINHKITSNYESEYEVVDLKEDYSLVDDKEELIKSENRRRKIHFQPYWLKGTDSNGHQIKTYIEKFDDFHVHCTLCNKTIATHYSGRSAIEKHYQSKSHVKIAILKLMVK